MDQFLCTIGEIGIVPVVRIERAEDALDLGRALLSGDLPIVEIAFRTAAAEQAIRSLASGLPDLLVGAGTVLDLDQVKRAFDAGAKFIVSPGFLPKVVDYCTTNNIPVIPGICTPTEIEMALERKLEVVKFFPAGASGGLEYLKAIAAPFGALQFIPTGGVDAANLREYLSFPRIHAVGGTWIARDTTIAAGRFDEITRLAREAVGLTLDFTLAHLGINERSAESAMALAKRAAELFLFPVKDGASSLFTGAAFEIMKSPYLGDHGHIAISTSSIQRAIAFLRRKGVAVKQETAREREGRLTTIYLDIEIGGFAVHLLQR